MTKYLINRILRSLFSVIMVVGIVMVLIYSCLDRTLIFMQDPLFSKVKSNGKEVYMMQQWERYGYLEYIPYADFMKDLLRSGEITQEEYDSAIKLGKNENVNTEILVKICQALHCNIDEIMDIVEQKEDTV